MIALENLSALSCEGMTSTIKNNETCMDVQKELKIPIMSSISS